MDTLSFLYRGGVEGLGSEPRFLVDDSTGQRLVDERLTAKKVVATLGHQEALGVLLEWIECHEAGLTLIGAGRNRLSPRRLPSRVT
jgi:hypothetical protein